MNKTSIILSVVVAALFLTLAGCIVGLSFTLKQRKNWEHNYRVMQDSVKRVTTKYGEVLFERSSLLLEKKELEEALGITKKQVRDYEKTLGSKLAYISKLESLLERKDTVTITVEKIVHDTLSNSYTGFYQDKWLSFNQRFTLANPFSYKFDVWGINMNIPMKVGLTDDYTIFVQSDNPYFNVSEIEGAVIDKSRFAQKPKCFGVGVQFGFGACYGLQSKQLDAGPYIGFGLSYNFLRF